MNRDRAPSRLRARKRALGGTNGQAADADGRDCDGPALENPVPSAGADVPLTCRERPVIDLRVSPTSHATVDRRPNACADDALTCAADAKGWRALMRVCRRHIRRRGNGIGPPFAIAGVPLGDRRGSHTTSGDPSTDPPAAD
jgi:hypothetical protein